MKDYIKKIIDLIFPNEKIDFEKMKKFLKSRNFYDRKNNFYSILPYSNQYIKKNIIDLKFHNKKENAEIFGEILFEFLVEKIPEWEIQENFYNPILITVPIPFLRKIKRGYNQNDLIIQKFMDFGGENFLKWEKRVLKKKYRKPQSKIKDKKERLQNQKNAFKLINAEKIKNQNIILFDDIYTTGATIKEIEKILKKAGVKKIKIVVLAH